MTCVLTERTVQTIVADLETDGYLRRVRDGRRNRYEISPGAVFKHPAEAGVQVAGLLALLTGAPSAPGLPDPLEDSPEPEPEALDFLALDRAEPDAAPAAPQDAPLPHVTTPDRPAE
ncbi:hypothetical protein ACFWBC_21870 [Streptomyces sp. NPDC059985]|uniref:hypothetical protein n=1 Tax=Streptomyces sp. NPDC059985 TaxID=3347025 RepID=UPI0036A5FC24